MAMPDRAEPGRRGCIIWLRRCGVPGRGAGLDLPIG
jgi:hypothetical protein